MSISKACSLEIFDLLHKAQEAASHGDKELSAIYRSKVDVLRVSGVSSAELRGTYAEALGDTLGVSSFEARYSAGFSKYLAGRKSDAEMRAIADSGTAPNSQTFVDGPAGAYFVPQGFDETIRDAETQSSGGLLSPAYISIIDEPTFGLPAKSVQGYDLTTVAASSTAESTQQIDTPNLSVVAPAYSAQITNAPLYRVALAASIEAEEDENQFKERIGRAVGVAMARKIGADVITTLKNAISSTYTTANSGYVTLDDLQQIVFGVDRLYRQGLPNVLAPVGHCCWVMNDSVWQRINRSGSGQSATAKGVPYLDVRSCPGIEFLCGYPVVITPDLNGLSASPVVNGDIFFGDLSKLILRRGKMYGIRSFQSKGVGGVDYGQVTLRFTQRAGSVFFDAGSAAAPAVVRATVTV